MVFSFLMINSIWIVTMFLMQQYKDVLGIKWGLTAEVISIDWNPDDQGGYSDQCCCCEFHVCDRFNDSALFQHYRLTMEFKRV